MEPTTSLIELPLRPASRLRRLWHADAVTTVISRDAYGTPLCEVRYRRWHPRFWVNRIRLTLSPPRSIICALGETCEVSN